MYKLRFDNFLLNENDDDDDAAEMSDDRSASSVAFVESGRSCGDRLNDVNQCSTDDVTIVNGIGAKEDVNKQAEEQNAMNFDYDA